MASRSEFLRVVAEMPTDCETAEYVWPLRVVAETHAHNGERLWLDVIIEGAGNPKAAMWHYVHSLKRSWEWLGVEITGITPLGQKVSIVYEEDSNHE